MADMNNWLNNYTNNAYIPVTLPQSGPSASTSSGSGDSPVASTSTTSPSQEEEQQQARPAVKDKKRRACDACRIRRIRCQRTDARNEACDSCIKMDIRCVESKPKARTSQKGARIAQAKLLYGDSSSNNALAIVVRQNKALQDQSRPRTPSASEVLMVASIDAGLLLNELIPAVAKLKIARFPLLRWIDIDDEYQKAGGRLSNMDGESQALFFALAALSSRSSHSELVVGKGAPTLADVSKSPSLRSGTILCEYGRRRERVASEMMQVAYRMLNEQQLFAKPTLKSVAALATVEMLILVYQDSLAFTRSASKNARPLSSAVASHLRIMAEECAGQPSAPFGFYSVAWTAIIRDALVSSVTGRALDFTTNDVFIILKVDETEPIAVPTGQALLDSWLCMKHPLEGPMLMQLWACVIKVVRKFVNEVTQPLAAARPRLKLDVFDDLYGTLRAARESFTEALLLLSATNVPQPEQKRILKYCIDFMLAQAHRIVLWRCSEEQLARAQSAPSSVGGIQQDDFETYKSKLQSLRVRSAEEAFQAARRIMSNITETFSPSDAGSAEFFVPGYFIHEGLLVWTSLIVDTSSLEEGGRVDYRLSDKLDDLKALREALAITGWSSGLIQPHLEQLNNVITGLEARQRMITAPSPPFFADYVNMSPPPQSPGFTVPTYEATTSEPFSRLSFNNSYGHHHHTEPDGGCNAPSSARIEEILQAPVQPNQWVSGGMQGDATPLSAEPLPSSEYIDQFLKSIGFQMYQ